MKPWYGDKKAKVVQFYFETKSVTLTQRKLRKHFKATKAPSRNVTFKIVNKFLAKVTVHSNFKQHSGCKRSQRASVTVARVRDALQRRSQVDAPTRSGGLVQLRCGARDGKS